MNYKVELISGELAEKLCREITEDLPDYFGLPEANERYFAGMQSSFSLAAKVGDKYV